MLDICDEHELQPTVLYLQSNGKIERWQRSLESEFIRLTTPLFLEDAQRLGRQFVVIYNVQRWHSAIGYITPQDKLEGREAVVLAEWKRKLAEAGASRARLRQLAHSEGLPGTYLRAQECTLQTQHSILLRRGETPVHAEPT